MKNGILTFISGMALGAVAMGIGIIDLNSTFAACLTIPGMAWLVPFVYANKERFKWVLE